MLQAEATIMFSINSALVKVIYIPVLIFYSFLSLSVIMYMILFFFKARHYIIKNEMQQKRVFYANAGEFTRVNENHL